MTMTVPYRNSFLKSMFHYHGSMWSAVWKDLAAFMVLYYAINLPLRFATSPAQRQEFKLLQDEISKKLSRYNLIFILGFFLSHIVSRWWHQFELASSNPFGFVSSMTAHVRKGEHMDEALAQNRRYCVMRWLMQMTILSWSRHCIRIKKRFPSIDHFVSARLATAEEADMLKQAREHAPYGNWWQPSIWIHNLIAEMLREGSIDSILAVHLIEKLDKYRSKLGKLMNYHWVPIPLPYTQLVTSATYAYFLTELILHQMTQADLLDTVVPIFFIIQFILIVGTLRVSEEIMDPFGEDSDDFEVNWLLDWSINTCHLQIGKLHGQMPDIVPSSMMQEDVVQLNHTVGSKKMKVKAYISRVNTWAKLKPADMQIAQDSIAKPDLIKNRFFEQKISNVVYDFAEKIEPDAISRPKISFPKF